MESKVKISECHFDGEYNEGLELIRPFIKYYFLDRKSHNYQLDDGLWFYSSITGVNNSINIIKNPEYYHTNEFFSSTYQSIIGEVTLNSVNTYYDNRLITFYGVVEYIKFRLHRETKAKLIAFLDE